MCVCVSYISVWLRHEHTAGGSHEHTAGGNLRMYRRWGSKAVTTICGLLCAVDTPMVENRRGRWMVDRSRGQRDDCRALSASGIVFVSIFARVVRACTRARARYMLLPWD